MKDTSRENLEGMIRMGSKLSEEEKSNEEKRKLFDKRKESAEMMAKFNRRHFSNLRKNWEIKQKDHLLPNAKTIFKFIEENLSEIEILKNSDNVKEWYQVVRDEEFIESRIQENIAILSWVYWQRLEGYETLDVSLSRERLVEDIGCIQQFYNAADGLILEYQRCFSIQLPIEIMCVYGLFQHFHTSFRHFIMVPNQTRYGYIPAWISVAHEVAHIAIDEIEKKYNDHYREWQKKEEIRKRKIEIGEMEHLRDSIEPEKIQTLLRNGEIPEEVKRVTENFKDIINRIHSEIKEREVEEALSEILEKITSSYSKLKSANKSRKNHSSLYNSLYDHLKGMSSSLVTIGNSLEYYKISDHNKEKFSREILKIVFEIFSVREAVLTEKLSLLLFKNPEKGNVDKFFLEWKKIKRRAIDIAETALHVLEGDTGLIYLNEPDPKDMRHVYNAEHILADILATLIAGEFYLYSLAFYRFLPSVFPAEEKVILRKQWVPMSLRLFTCLETLKHSSWKEMKNVLNRLETLWMQLAIDYNKLERIEEIVKRLRSKMVDTPYALTVDLLWNLIKSIMEEDLFLENKCKKLLKEAEETEEAKDKSDRSYFNYMRHALGNTLKQMLRNPKGFLVGVDCEGNCLKELIELVSDNLIDNTELFTAKKRYEIIEKIRKQLVEGEVVFNIENCYKKEKSDHEYHCAPRNILSAYAQTYFEHILNPKENKRDYIDAFNATVMSLAWTQHALERFYDGAPEGRGQ